MNYRTDKELRYYGSDLNKFINEFCSKDMTVNNIDLLMYKWKNINKYLRIIEYKHIGENIPHSQYKLLKILSKAKFTEYEYGVYVVVGNYPYNEVKITNIKTNKLFILKKQDFINWLEFRLDLDKKE